MQVFLKKVAKKFGRSKKKQYLCTRFAPEISESQKRQKSNCKNVMLKISHLQRKCKVFEKKLLKNLVSPKKSSTFAADFAINEKLSEKQ